MFAKKLDLLMKVSSCSNSCLGRALSFDPSYIGCIRTGKRGFPKNNDFLKNVASFFSKSINDPIAKKVLSDAIGYTYPSTKEEAEIALLEWLEKNDDFLQPVTRLLNDFSDNTTLPTLPKQNVVTTPLETSYYYGNQGKRDGVKTFLENVCATNKPQLLLLYSDECFSWLYEDEIFSKTWALLLTKLINNGCRIVIIHTINRNIGEMMEAINKWLPLYSSGHIEPYYYPKIRDGVYHRTLFIAQHHSALFSTSIGENTKNTLNILIYNQEATLSLEEEFNDYFSLCKPLIEIYTQRNLSSFIKMIHLFNEKKVMLF